jgi:hypothetical protein
MRNLAVSINLFTEESCDSSIWDYIFKFAGLLLELQVETLLSHEFGHTGHLEVH